MRTRATIIGALIALAGVGAAGQSGPPVEARARLEPPVPTGPPTNSAPNPYRTIRGWLKMPPGRDFGSTGGVAVDQRGHVWVAERCGVHGFIAASCGSRTADARITCD